MGLYTAPHDPAPEGRYVLDYETALAEGLTGVITRAQHQIDNHEVTDYESADKLFFWRAGIRVLQAAITWAEKHAVLAKKLAKKEIDPHRKAELLQIAKICTRVPANPPKTFREACKPGGSSILRAHRRCTSCYSPGRFDRYMYPYYKRDLMRV